MPNAIVFYRISRFFYERKVPILPKFFQLIIFLLYNSKVPPTASVGKGSFLVCKGVGVVIIDRAILGEGCRIGIGCKIVGKSPYREVPKIGNNVFIGPGAVICGPIIIEDNVIVAPNSVVTKSIPKGAIVGGIPAKIIGSVDNIGYNIFDNNASKEGFMPFMGQKSDVN